MFTEKGIFPIGDGLLDVDADRLKGLLVSHDINEIYEVEQTPFARWVSTSTFICSCCSLFCFAKKKNKFLASPKAAAKKEEKTKK